MVAVVAHQCGVAAVQEFSVDVPSIFAAAYCSAHCQGVCVCALVCVERAVIDTKTTMFVSQITVLSWRFEWLATLLDELLLLYVFLHVLFTFRPLKPMDFSSVRQGRAGQHGVVGQVGLGRGG